MGLNDAFIRAKERLAKQRRPSAAGDGKRIPPGQFVSDRFPVLEISIDRPPIDLATWDLEVSGEVDLPRSFSWKDFQELKKTSQVSDFHCVTRWSKLDVKWAGVRWLELLAAVKPKPSATHALLACADGYTTNLPLAELRRETVLLADTLDGQPLPQEHGGPMRLVVPHLYGWKSAKFLRKIRFSAADEPGFWEVRGYHNHGDPWTEERYG